MKTNTPTLLSRPRSRVLATVSIAFVVTQFDVTIVTIALPSIGAQLHAAVSELQWIGDAYTLAFSA